MMRNTTEIRRAYGPYHLIIDSVGGKTLASALSLLATGATCLTMGWSASPEVTIDIRELIRNGRTTLYGLNFMEELNHHGGFKDLAWLAQMVARQQLKTSIEVEASWHEIGDVAQRLLQRQFTWQSCSASKKIVIFTPSLPSLLKLAFGSIQVRMLRIM